jgi:tripartite-type tricarboxylate transporter receptor subunit TctC
VRIARAVVRFPAALIVAEIVDNIVAYLQNARQGGRAMKIVMAAALACMLAAVAHAQPAFPAKPVRIVNPFAAGGATDIVARQVAQKLTELWGQAVVVENKPGASGAIGLESVARSAPDGYTLAIATQTTHAANPALYAKLAYDAERDFAPLTLAGSTPLALVVNPALPIANVRELVAYAKANPGKLRYASGGNGSSQHLTGELLRTAGGLDIIHVPYKGAGPAMVDMLGGQVDFMFDNLPTALPHIKAGKLRGLAVTSAARSPLAPELPTMAEAGVPNFELATWFAFFAPATTPRALVEKISADMRRVLAEAETKEKLAAIGVDIRTTTPDELAAFQKAEMQKWGKIVRDSGAKVD